MGFHVPYPKPEYSYSGHCPVCHGWLTLIVDDPRSKRDVGKVVARAIEAGQYIKRTHDSKVREEVLDIGSCKCEDEPTPEQYAMEM